MADTKSSVAVSQMPQRQPSDGVGEMMLDELHDLGFMLLEPLLFQSMMLLAVLITAQSPWSHGRVCLVHALQAVAAATFRNVEGALAGGRSSSYGPDSPTGVIAHIWRTGGESACSSVCGAAASHNTSFTGSISTHKDNILDWLQAPEESPHVYGHAMDKRSGSKTVRKTSSALHLTAVLEELPQQAKGPGEQTCSQPYDNHDSMAAQHTGAGSAVRLQPNLKRASPRWGATEGNEDMTPATMTSTHSATGPGAATGSSPNPLSSGRSQTRLSPHLSAGPQATSPRGSVNGHGSGRMSYLAPPGKAALQQRLNMALNLSGRYSS